MLQEVMLGSGDVGAITRIAFRIVGQESFLSFRNIAETEFDQIASSASRWIRHASHNPTHMPSNQIKMSQAGMGHAENHYITLQLTLIN